MAALQFDMLAQSGIPLKPRSASSLIKMLRINALRESTRTQLGERILAWCNLLFDLKTLSLFSRKTSGENWSNITSIFLTNLLRSGHQTATTL
jgi:hypothetical protein